MDKDKLSKKDIEDANKLVVKYKKKYVAVNKKGRVIALSLLSALAIGGGSAAGYFGYKAAHSTIVEEQKTKKVTESIELSCDVADKYIDITDLSEEKSIHLNVSVKPTNQSYEFQFVNLDDSAKDYVSLDSNNVVHVKPGCPNCTVSLKAIASDHVTSNVINVAILNDKDISNLDKFDFTLSEDDYGNKYYACSIKDKYRYSIDSIIVPSKYKNIEVRLKYEAFQNCYALRSVFIPKEITYISDSCFYANISLESVIFEKDSTLSAISDEAFSYCSSLTSIDLPSSLLSLGEYYIYKNSNKSLTSGGNIFTGCSALRKIYIPANVKYISNSNFIGCYLLTEMVVDPLNEFYTSRDDKGNECNGIFGLAEDLLDTEDNMYGLISGCCTTRLPEKISIDGNIFDDNIINSDAFNDCTLLKSFTIPDSVVAIGNRAFTDCENLVSLDIGKNLIYFGYTDEYTTLGENFEGLTSLSKINVSTDNQYFYTYDGLLYGYIIETSDRKLKVNNSSDFDISLLACPCKLDKSEITVPRSINNHNVIEVYSNVFSDCKNVNKVTFEAGSKISYIYSDAFINSYITSIVNFPASVTSFYSDVFTNLYATLEELTFEDKSSDWLYDGETLFNGSNDCEKIMGILIEKIGVGANRTISKGTITPESSSNKYVICSSDGASISSYDLTGVTSFIMDSDVTLKGKQYDIVSTCDLRSWSSKVFNDSSSVTSLTLSSNLSKIGSYSFNYFGSSAGCTITIPDDSNLSEISEYAFYRSYISGDLILPSSLTSLGVCSFYNCPLLESIDLSNCTSINTLPRYSLSVIDVKNPEPALKSVKLPPNLLSIDYNALSGIVKLESIELPQTLISIGNYAFQKCTSLSSIEIPNSVTSIGYSAFYNCSSLSSIDLSNLDHVIEGGNGMFTNCNLSAGSIKVRSDLLEEYKSAEYWSDYAEYMVGV